MGLHAQAPASQPAEVVRRFAFQSLPPIFGVLPVCPIQRVVEIEKDAWTARAIGLDLRQIREICFVSMCDRGMGFTK